MDATFDNEINALHRQLDMIQLQLRRREDGTEAIAAKLHVACIAAGGHGLPASRFRSLESSVATTRRCDTSDATHSAGLTANTSSHDEKKHTKKNLAGLVAALAADSYPARHQIADAATSAATAFALIMRDRDTQTTISSIFYATFDRLERIDKDYQIYDNMIHVAQEAVGLILWFVIVFIRVLALGKTRVHVKPSKK